MQNAQTLLLETVEGLLEENEVEKALDTLLELDRQTEAGIRQDVILASGSFREAAKQYQRQLISFEEYARFSARTRYALSELMKEVPRKVVLNARVRSLSSYQFDVPDNARLEKILGPTSHLLRINWLEKALAASKAVCRVICSDGTLGTGFLTKEGYIFTNNHVISSPEVAKTARVEFNYELGLDGNAKSRTSYELDHIDFLSSPQNDLDFTRVKVLNRVDAPLSQWGYVEFDPEAIPSVGEAVTIVQHPKGEDKQIALNANDVVGQLNQHLFYMTDTELGSSGSPVFNKDWKAVAIHHAGKTKEEDGLVINAKGERRGANRGVLFRDIFLFIAGEKAVSKVGGSTGQESFAIKDPLAKSSEPPPTQAGASKAQHPQAAIPKFVVIYDVNDAVQCQMLNRHLNVLKIIKKIRVYNVYDALPGEDLVARATSELADADYILALVTANLFNSEWFGMVSSSIDEGRRIIPIRIEKADFEGTGLEKLKSLPSMGKAVSDFANADSAYADIVGELKKLLPK